MIAYKCKLIEVTYKNYQNRPLNTVIKETIAL